MSGKQKGGKKQPQPAPKAAYGWIPVAKATPPFIVDINQQPVGVWTEAGPQYFPTVIRNSSPGLYFQAEEEEDEMEEPTPVEVKYHRIQHKPSKRTPGLSTKTK